MHDYSKERYQTTQKRHCDTWLLLDEELEPTSNATSIESGVHLQSQTSHPNYISELTSHGLLYTDITVPGAMTLDRPVVLGFREQG